MATVRLDERRIRTLKPRKSAYDIRDRNLKGFGVRVMPSGAKRYFVHSQYGGQRFWKIVGHAGSIGADEARDRARMLMASIREGTKRGGRRVGRHPLRDGRRRSLPALRPKLETGPRTVWLSSAARVILDSLPREAEWIFPSPLTESCLHTVTVGSIWNRLRAEASLSDVRLHDLRHTFASHAVLQGVPLPVVSRLLGHKQPNMTLRYAHVGDRETEAAAERIGAAIARALDDREAGLPD